MKLNALTVYRILMLLAIVLVPGQLLAPPPPPSIPLDPISLFVLGAGGAIAAKKSYDTWKSNKM